VTATPKPGQRKPNELDARDSATATILLTSLAASQSNVLMDASAMYMRDAVSSRAHPVQSGSMQRGRLNMGSGPCLLIVGLACQGQCAAICQQQHFEYSKVATST
jgi:hypothetical protein